jgi:type IV pilus assembly protein PilE
MNKQQGFTLIELMIVVAILGILLAIAVPQYSSYVVKTRRVDAQQEIVSYGQSLERYYTANGTYQNSGATACGVAAPTASTYYTFSGNCGANSYTVTATAKSGASQASDGNQSITNTGLKTGKWSQ